MDCIVYGVTKSWTRLSDFHFMWSLGVLIKHLDGSPKCSPLNLGPNPGISRNTLSQASPLLCPVENVILLLQSQVLSPGFSMIPEALFSSFDRHSCNCMQNWENQDYNLNHSIYSSPFGSNIQVCRATKTYVRYSKITVSSSI